ncbi:Rv0361 family membrane protein [Micromonospora sp. LZ34]
MQPPAGSQVSRVPAQRTPPDQLAPPPATPAPERPRRRLRTVLTVVAGVLAVLCLGGVVAGFVLYNRAATPDRSAPDVAVVSYLQAALVSRDQGRAALFTCDGSLPSIDNFRSEVERREQELSVGFSINIENVVVSTSGPAKATVMATIRRSASVDGVQQSLTDAWQFEVEDRDGWQVCAGAPVS